MNIIEVAEALAKQGTESGLAWDEFVMALGLAGRVVSKSAAIRNSNANLVAQGQLALARGFAQDIPQHRKPITQLSSGNTVSAHVNGMPVQLVRVDNDAVPKSKT